MQVLNLLKFLNNAKTLHTLDFITCDSTLLDFLELVSDNEMLIQKIDLGVIFIKSNTLTDFVIVDGLTRILSLSLLLHAVCECYKKTSPKNEKAIENIRKKYLLNGSKTKLKLPEDMQVIYNKIIFGERLSGKEKKSSMFLLLHKFWARIKEEKLQAIDIFNSLNKIYVMSVDTDNAPLRDLYYSLNKEKRNLKQSRLIKDFLQTLGLINYWDSLSKILKNNKITIEVFLKDFFNTKFNFKEYNPNLLYEIFINYFGSMLKFMPKDELMDKFVRSAMLYSDIVNISFENEKIKQLFIRIKMHNGEDTYSYLLSIYEDYLENRISESTFIEILSTIDEYLVNRLKTPNNVSFNELINYLSTFIICK